MFRKLFNKNAIRHSSYLHISQILIELARSIGVSLSDSLSFGNSKMNGLDVAIVIALSVGAIYGLTHGAIRMLTSVVALAGGIYFASIYYPGADNSSKNNSALVRLTASLIGYLVLFGALFFVIEMVGSMLMRMLLVVHLSWADRLVGAAVGATIMAVATGSS